MLGMDTCRLCRWTWIPGTMGSMKRIIIVQFLSPLFRLLHLCLFLRLLSPFLHVLLRAKVRYPFPFLRRDFVATVLVCTYSIYSTYVCTRRDLVKHTSAIHHSICEPLCHDKRFCVPEELVSIRKYNIKCSCKVQSIKRLINRMAKQ